MKCVVKIEKFDDKARGITYYNDKIVFVYGALPKEEVQIEIYKEKKKYYLAKMVELKRASDKRVDAKCPYFNECGGCNLLHMSYADSLEFKIEKIKRIFSRALEIDFKNINVISNPKPFSYRNKVTLKVEDGSYGFYEEGSLSLVRIDFCYVTKESINKVLKNIEHLNVNNGEVIIRSNYKDEILVSINSLENVKPNIKKITEGTKIVGIIVNNKKIYGEENFIEKVGSYYFEVNYNSFFQINTLINEKLFELIAGNINNKDIILDLYCGVGTLSIASAKKAKYVYGVEIEKSSINNAIHNAELNKVKNIEFKKLNASKVDIEFDKKITKIILDPPRGGLDIKTIEKIIKIEPESIIYISCDPFTLVRDLKVLKDYYSVHKYYLIDMFSYTYHVESFVVLKKRQIKNFVL